MSGMSDLNMTIENYIYEAMENRYTTEESVVRYVQGRLREDMQPVPDSWIRNVYDIVIDDWFCDTDMSVQH